MRTIFVDTSYLLALEFPKDQNHALVKQHWQQLKSSPVRLVTTTYIFDELVTVLNSRGHYQKAVTTGRSILNSQLFQLIHVDEMLFSSAWQFFQKHCDKNYSFTDCMSFVVMQKYGITTACTLDKHFAQAGFIKEPHLL